jgi:hypothetical protein
MEGYECVGLGSVPEVEVEVEVEVELQQILKIRRYRSLCDTQTECV